MSCDALGDSMGCRSGGKQLAPLLCKKIVKRGRAVRTHSCASKSTILRKKSFDWNSALPCNLFGNQLCLRACDVDAHGCSSRCHSLFNHKMLLQGSGACNKGLATQVSEKPHFFFSRGLTARTSTMPRLLFLPPPWKKKWGPTTFANPCA